MSIGLFNDKGGHFNSGDWGWISLFFLASMYGWDRKGTKPSKGFNNKRDWDSQDYSNKHSPTVTFEDAQAMADSVEKAIQDLTDPPEDPLSKSFTPYEKEFENRLEMIKNAIKAKKPDPSILGFSKKNKKFLDEFVTFCRQGEFRIL